MGSRPDAGGRPVRGEPGKVLQSPLYRTPQQTCTGYQHKRGEYPDLRAQQVHMYRAIMVYYIISRPA
jgi:hypothetical protein